MDMKRKLASLEQDIHRSLQELVSIPSVKVSAGDRDAANGAPFGKGPQAALDYVLDLCGRLGFATKNCDGYVGYAEIGQGDEMLAMLVHLDVVPEGSGWTHPPYGGEIHEGKLYGRGAIDDKGPAVACIYALKAVADLGISLNKRVRIIFGLDEETDWEDMDHYVEHEEIPTFGFTPDADFPAIYGEKGILMVTLTAPLDRDAICKAEGGEAPNMVPDRCRVCLETAEGTVTVEKTGKAAHGSMPEEGVNAIAAAMEEVYRLKEEKGLQSPFADFYHDKVRACYHGEAMELDLEDEESGKLTVNPGTISVVEDRIRLQLDIRYPVTLAQEDVLSRIEKAGCSYGVEISAVIHREPVYMDKDGELVRALMAVYREVTGDDSPPLTMGGGTYARAMPNIVAFGPLFPGRPCVEHQKDEYIRLDDLKKITEIYARAIIALASYR